MTTIHLITKIKAPVQTVFDLARNIDIHQQSTSKSNEKAIGGITSGLINLNENCNLERQTFWVLPTARKQDHRNGNPFLFCG
ncbi:MAG: hypothetical protein QM783_21120 [Phycisphaerales bacterium]